MPGHDGCNMAPLCVSQRGIFLVMMHRRSDGRLRYSTPTVIVSSEPRGAAAGGVKAKPLSPHSTFQPCHSCQLGRRGWKVKRSGRVASSRSRVTIQTGIMLHFLRREKGGIGHESPHNPEWWVKALVFKKQTASVTWNSSGDSSGARRASHLNHCSHSCYTWNLFGLFGDQKNWTQHPNSYVCFSMIQPSFLEK